MTACNSQVGAYGRGLIIDLSISFFILDLLIVVARLCVVGNREL